MELCVGGSIPLIFYNLNFLSFTLSCLLYFAELNDKICEDFEFERLVFSRMDDFLPDWFDIERWRFIHSELLSLWKPLVRATDWMEIICDGFFRCYQLSGPQWGLLMLRTVKLKI